jgi:hypothetical protein
MTDQIRQVVDLEVGLLQRCPERSAGQLGIGVARSRRFVARIEIPADVSRTDPESLRDDGSAARHVHAEPLLHASK